jgi:hypothetical protein
MTLSRGIQELAKGGVLAPILRYELTNPRFEGFTIEMDGWTDRPWDGWFHPSTHATWTPRQLALYLTQPQLIETEQPTMEMVVAVTQGHFLHHLIGNVLLGNGVVEALEIPGEDPVHNRKGHMDGRRGEEGVEFKSINREHLLNKITDAESLRRLKPGYYGQAQDYIDMHGLTGMRFLFFGVMYPYPMGEFVVPRDDEFIAAQRTKYLLAQELAAAGEIGEACCHSMDTEALACPLRQACPVGQRAMRRSA